jgi:molybdopterin-guanine dinucleotide biosynthesis protein A
MSVATGVPGVHAVAVNQSEEDTLDGSNVFYGGGRGTASTMQHLGDILEKYDKGVRWLDKGGPVPLARITPVIQDKIHEFYDDKIARLKDELALTDAGNTPADLFRRHRAVMHEFQGDLRIARHGHIALILNAGGKGSRLNSDHANPLYPIAGKSAILYPLEGFSPFVDSTVAVVRPEDVRSYEELFRHRSERIAIVPDPDRKGDWDGLREGLEALRDDAATIIVAWGDLVVVSQDRIREALLDHIESGAAMTIPTMFARDPYVSVLTDERGRATEMSYRSTCEPSDGSWQCDCSFFILQSAALHAGLDELERRYDDIDSPTPNSLKFMEIVEFLHENNYPVKALPICQQGDFQNFTMQVEAASISAYIQGMGMGLDGY